MGDRNLGNRVIRPVVREDTEQGRGHTLAVLAATHSRSRSEADNTVARNTRHWQCGG